MASNTASLQTEKRAGFFKKPFVMSLSSSIICILLGFLVGYIVLLCTRPTDSWKAITLLFTGGFSSTNTISQFLYMTPSILMTGLAVAFTFKAGLFNIGGPGQYIAGAAFSLVGCIVWKLPWYVDIMLGFVGGALLGALPGLLKAYFNINEVLSAIMLNWIALIAVDLILRNIPAYVIDETVVGSDVWVWNTGIGDMLPGYSDVTYRNIQRINANGIIPGLFNNVVEDLKTQLANLIANGANMESDAYTAEYVRLNNLISFYKSLDYSLVISAIVAIIIFVVIQKTTFGYELKACGMNKDAAKYSGIADKRTIIISFMISGALAGLGGGMHYLQQVYYSSGYSLATSSLPSQGFDGISVALLAANSPIGCIFSALLIAYLNVAAGSLSTLNMASEFVTVIISVIIYCASFAAFVKEWLGKGGVVYWFNRLFKRKKPVVAATEAAAVAPAVSSAPSANPVTPAASAPSSEKPEEEKKAPAPSEEEEDDSLKPDVIKEPPHGEISDSMIAEVARSKPEVKKEMSADSESGAAGDTDKKDGVSSPSGYSIDISPFARNLDGYNPESVSNIDDAELTRVSAPEDKKDAGSEAESIKKEGK